jgi:ABC-type transporter Mla subunit MlaD
MYDTVEDESTQLLSFLGALDQRRAALEQQRDDIEAVLKEIARFERQCRDMLKADEAASPGSPRKKSPSRCGS